MAAVAAYNGLTSDVPQHVSHKERALHGGVREEPDIQASTVIRKEPTGIKVIVVGAGYYLFVYSCLKPLITNRFRRSYSSN